MGLAERDCVPCKGGVPPVTGSELQELGRQVPGWQVIEEHHLVKDFKFPDFARALAFVNNIGVIAESQGHHPDLELAWGRVGVKVWTHKINGLTVSDFVLAAKIDQQFALAET